MLFESMKINCKLCFLINEKLIKIFARKKLKATNFLFNLYEILKI
jgi:hypothetical protein